MRVLVLVAGLLLAFPVAAGAADILINNGLDCSNPGNVIDHDTYQSDDVYVRNVGCGTPNPGSPCPSPGAPTQVCVEVGGDVHGLNAYDSSTVAMSGGEVNLVVFGYDSATVTMNDGMVGLLFARESATLTMSGGWVEYLFADGSSTVTVTGTGFAVDGSPVPFGDLAAQMGMLTGRLASGDPIDTLVCPSAVCTGTVTLAPPGYLVVPALSLSGKLLLAAALLGSAVV